MDMNQGADWRDQRRQEREERRQARWAARQARRASYRPNPAAGAIFGLLMVAAGVMFLLRNLGVIFIDSLWNYWPVILIALGASKLFQSEGGRDNFGGSILVLIGGVFLLRNLGFLWLNPFALIGPGILIFFGIMILMRNMYGPDWWGGSCVPSPRADAAAPPAAGPTPRYDTTSENRLNAQVMFGGIHRRINSQEFEGGRISTTIGGVEIDLRDAKMKGLQAFLQVDVIMGGVEIRVPDGWMIEVHGSPVFGGFDDRTSKPADPANAPKLIIQGSVMFGGVSVRN
jgi:predicted membrane protein